MLSEIEVLNMKNVMLDICWSNLKCAKVQCCNSGDKKMIFTSILLHWKENYWTIFLSFCRRECIISFQLPESFYPVSSIRKKVWFYIIMHIYRVLFSTETGSYILLSVHLNKNWKKPSLSHTEQSRREKDVVYWINS